MKRQDLDRQPEIGVAAVEGGAVVRHDLQDGRAPRPSLPLEFQSLELPGSGTQEGHAACVRLPPLGGRQAERRMHKLPTVLEHHEQSCVTTDHLVFQHTKYNLLHILCKKFRRFEPFPDPPPSAQAASPSTEAQAVAMKISTVFVAAFAAAACLLQPTAAEDQASVHLRVHLEKDVCYVQCPSGQYCPNDGKKQCRAPRGKECFERV
ncbi:hypothetical protein ON010_g15558 [Phytophthora cinnamomi]|nr:hypothetical protein ON010_g15558 [Phytophthora cinnamomi]